jgi:CheY-like chemotaxis protein
MGLYLSRKIIDMHGGSIGVDLDWEGPGSIFFIELLTSEKPELNPLGNIIFLDVILGVFSTCVMFVNVARKLSAQFNTFDPITGKQPSSELKMSEIVRSYSTAAGIRLLIVDDAVLCRKFHHRILSPSVQDIIEAGDGHEAVNIVKASLVNGHPIDGILIDSSMPFLNGPPAVKMIRELGYTGKIFGVTGNAYQSDIDDFLAHGVNEVLIKPLSIEKYGYVVQKVYQSVAAQEHNIVVVDN